MLDKYKSYKKDTFAIRWLLMRHIWIYYIGLDFINVDYNAHIYQGDLIDIN